MAKPAGIFAFIKQEEATHDLNGIIKFGAKIGNMSGAERQFKLLCVIEFMSAIWKIVSMKAQIIRQRS